MFALSLILGPRNVQFSVCHLFGCFDPRLKENALCHPAFVIRDINIVETAAPAQGRLKSRKSYHCCKCYRIQISYKTHHKTFRHFQSGRTPVLEAGTMDYVTNHNMITMAISISKTINMAAECGGM